MRAGGPGAVALAALLWSASGSAADYSCSPALNSSMDTDSNRYYELHGAASQSINLSGSLPCERATDTTQLSVTPVLHWQHFDKADYSPILEYDLNGEFIWTRELDRLDVTGQDSDYSTLSSELETTGLVSSRVHRRTEQGALTFTRSQTELLALVLSVSYANVSYYGAGSGLLELLTGYREPQGSIAERVSLTETSTLTPSVFTLQQQARIPGEDNRESGVQLDYARLLGERTQLDVAAGAYSSDELGEHGTGSIANAQISRSYDRGTIAASYFRGLTPYGTGVLLQQQKWTLSSTYGLTELLIASLNFTRTQNGAEPRIGLGARTYNTLSVGLDWKLLPAWTVHGELGTTRTDTATFIPQSVGEWRALVSIAWSPLVPHYSF